MISAFPVTQHLMSNIDVQLDGDRATARTMVDEPAGRGDARRAAALLLRRRPLRRRARAHRRRLADRPPRRDHAVVRGLAADRAAPHRLAAAAHSARRVDLVEPHAARRSPSACATRAGAERERVVRRARHASRRRRAGSTAPPPSPRAAARFTTARRSRRRARSTSPVATPRAPAAAPRGRANASMSASAMSAATCRVVGDEHDLVADELDDPAAAAPRRSPTRPRRTRSAPATSAPKSSCCVHAVEPTRSANPTLRCTRSTPTSSPIGPAGGILARCDDAAACRSRGSCRRSTRSTRCSRARARDPTGRARWPAERRSP